MSNLLIILITTIIKLYKYFISPILGNRCRFLPTCSEYFIESLKIHGVLKGLFLGFKRILSCHPIRLLGGSAGLDFVPNKKKSSRGKN
tara:strand:+ start:231 stop:494 length:264 start_codon:yes stop_codon:yes gene_type:complete